ncbi:MAG: hypothetical protein QXU20_04140 [Candidatus Woesearchaeota archaeon]
MIFASKGKATKGILFIIILSFLFYNKTTLAQNLTKNINFYREWDLLKEGTVVTEIPEHPLTANFTITRFDIFLEKELTNVRINIEKSLNHTEFEEISKNKSFVIYSFFKITQNIPNNSFEKIIIYFKVKKDFLKDKTPESISLLLVNKNRVEEQKTENYYNDEHFYYYKSEINSFDNLLVVLKEKPYEKIIFPEENNAEVKTENKTTSNQTLQNQTELIQNKTKRKSRNWLILPLIVMFLIIVYFIYETSRKKPKSVIIE